ncbi:uncharacterized protein LOC101235709 [Hydra vulgaris]|uniref:CB1 cannabinoid receptor-interacting protein 1 n=1 Tax=Hydra vulgaris TaxID=6087 RepID=A0ABM4CGH3_HYDVU
MPIVRASLITRIKKMTAEDNVNEEEKKPPITSKRFEERRTSLLRRRSSGFGTERKSLVSVSSGSSNASVINELKLNISFQLICAFGNREVYFKHDGNRFTEKHTIKLATATEYNIRMEIEPSVKLSFIKIANKECSFKPINKRDNEDKSKYQISWSTVGVNSTERRHRANVPCVIKFKHYKQLKFMLQTKFYTETELKRIRVGVKLKSVVLECTVGRGTIDSAVDSIFMN